MATTPCNQVEEDQMLLFSQHYSDLYTQMPQGEKRVRRRRKKAKEEERGMGWKKRRLSAEQVKFLEMNFGSEHKLESARKDMLAVELGLDPRQVAVWFQNRRARWKNKQLEEEYAKLKVEHEAIVVKKCQLQDEVLKLREELSDAHKEISKFSQQSDAASEGEGSGSHWSSFSLELHQPFLAEFGVEDAQDFFYIPQVEIGNYFGAMNLLDFYGIGM